MKNQITFVAITFLIIFFSAAAHAADREDKALCKGVAVKAAIVHASKEVQGKIKYVRSSVEELKLVRGLLQTEYSVDLNRCSPGDEDECGSLEYSVVILGKAPDCRVIKVTLEGEE